MKIAVIQENPTVGAVAHNAAMALRRYISVADDCDVALFPEAFLCGYPPEDLLFRPAFLDLLDNEAKTLARATAGRRAAMAIGSVTRSSGALYNAALWMQDGVVRAEFHKRHLPNYGVFDERRYFAPGRLPQSLTYNGKRVGLRLCEDMWNDDGHDRDDVDLILSLNASPYEKHKTRRRHEAAARCAISCNAPIMYANMVGGQDELVFDGASFALNANGVLCERASGWKKEALIWNVDALSPVASPSMIDDASDAYVLEALVTGLRDYVRKNGFSRVLIGMSGGIDSAAVAAVATIALGTENVRCVSLPSPYNSEEGREDARECARRLGVAFVELPIEGAMQTMGASFAKAFGEEPRGLGAENMQSRIRGTYLMTLSNHTGELLLTTGNKSEMAVGYATLYGDMCGAFNVLKDMYKTEIFSLCRHINAHALKSAVPASILVKAPSAELRPDQKDEDSLPPYSVLDVMLQGLIEGGLSPQDVAAFYGCDEKETARVAALVKNAEYKRRQSPPGVKISALSFGRERRYPLTSGFIA
ncbi:MAG: NAD+ synthase [Rickettsiales bacterium]